MPTCQFHGILTVWGVEDMSRNLTMVKDKVQRFLIDSFGRIEVLEDGGFSMRHGSAQMFIRCWSHDEDDAPVLVRIDCPVLFGAKDTPALFEYIALHADDRVFGHLHAERTDDGVMVLNTHTLLGDFLDQEELERACIIVAIAADELDDELQGRFGGERFHED